MNISELIAKLAEVKEEHGDLPVAAMIGAYGERAAEIDLVTAEEDDHFPHGVCLLE